MAKIIADYIAVLDGVAELRKGSPGFGRKFTLPTGTRFEQSMVFQWWFRARGDSATYKWSIEEVKGNKNIHRASVRSSSVSGGHFGTYHEVIKIPFPGTNLQVKALMTGGSGGVDLSDLVIWFQREV